MEDEKKRSHFFEQTFLLTGISMNIALEMPSITLSNIEINFTGCHLYWRTYTTGNVLLTISYVELIGKREFTTIVFDLEDKTFVVNIASLRKN